ncbi:MAG TPA: Clp protease N-terminal domain-containing protein [Acidimicrobiales bacterium]|nr:Clp protease N-terminal domain-containing protein [Acidimicrobiales bacterium]
MADDLPDVASLARSVFAAVAPSDQVREDALRRLDVAELIATKLHQRADLLVGYFLDHARLQGASWADVGRRLGVSRQAAYQRYSNLQERLTMTELLNTVTSALPPRAQAALRRAAEKARTGGHDKVLPQHILMGIVTGPGVATDVLASLGVRTDVLSGDLEATLPPPTAAPGEDEVPVGEETRRLLAAALSESSRLWHNYVGTEHMLLALAEDPAVGPVLAAHGAGPDQLRSAMQAQFPKLGLTGPSAPPADPGR